MREICNMRNDKLFLSFLEHETQIWRDNFSRHTSLFSRTPDNLDRYFACGISFEELDDLNQKAKVSFFPAIRFHSIFVYNIFLLIFSQS